MRLVIWVEGPQEELEHLRISAVAAVEEHVTDYEEDHSLEEGTIKVEWDMED